MFVLLFLGFGISFDGSETDKIYFSLYHPQKEYGMVLESNGNCYCDTILEKNND